MARGKAEATQEAAETSSGAGWTRRGLLLGGLGVAAGAAAGAAGAVPAAAATGAMQFGASNDATTSGTILTSSNSIRTLRAVNTGSGAGLEAFAANGTGLIAKSTGGTAISASAGAGLGVFAETTGVFAAIGGSGSSAPGVRGTSVSQAGVAGVSQSGNGVEATAEGFGAAVRAHANSGVGVLARSLSGPSVRLVSNLSALPGGGAGTAGDVAVVNRAGLGAPAEVWLCVRGGIPGAWRLLASPDAAGAFVPIVPVRVYDSRWVGVPGVTTGIIGPGTVRTISVANGRSTTGVVTQPNAVPAGATAVAMNITVDNTIERGNIAIVPGTVTTSATSSINWSSTGTVVANGITVQVDQANRTVNALGRSNNANLIVDVTGYYAAA